MVAVVAPRVYDFTTIYEDKSKLNIKMRGALSIDEDAKILIVLYCIQLVALSRKDQRFLVNLTVSHGFNQSVSDPQTDRQRQTE